MKKKQKRAVVSGPWDIAALVLAGLLYLIVAAFLVLAVAGIGLLIVYALEMGVAAECCCWRHWPFICRERGAWKVCPAACCWGRSLPGARCFCCFPWPLARWFSTPQVIRQDHEQ